MDGRVLTAVQNYSDPDFKEAAAKAALDGLLYWFETTADPAKQD